MPVIGVSVRYLLKDGKSVLYVFDRVRRSIQQAGGDVFLLVPIQDLDYVTTSNNDIPNLSEEEKEKINSCLDKCDGLFLPGGKKFTLYDRYILEYAVKKDIPTLGVCLSMQMMSCYEEEVKLELNNTEINHYVESGEVCHSVFIDKKSLLYKILGKEIINVNSIHNYHALENHIYKTVARSDDGIIEAIENPNCTFNIGVQWHPEKNYLNDIDSRRLIDYFIKEAEIYHNNKEDRNLL